MAMKKNSISLSFHVAGTLANFKEKVNALSIKNAKATIA
jgi:hypothetical protein